ncbi:beta-glucosidase-domain-containing protein [Hypoxylon argillaceum]|nr:beta-glucosidase-domain-containing protein [Hypoxylon argillaceum]KAI1145933.1 beta-glucosidase-domain-containing protein [Nemania diffusa]
MKTAVSKLAIAASFGSVALAQPHRHAHHVHHQKRDNSPLEQRDVVTTYVPATVTQYMLGNQEVTPEEAKAGLDKGLYVVVGETTPSFTPPPAPVATSTSSKEDGVFIEKVTTSSSSTVPTTTAAPTSTSTSSSSSTPVPTTSTAPVSSGATGIDADFPDGELDCTTFPSAYGALALDYLGLGGWSGLQYTPSYSLSDAVISYIETGISSPASQKGFYSYACPDGYVKTQWPASQGNTGQSIGGIFCNAQGKLELTRSDVSKKLCEAGIPGITIKNKMSSGTSVCRTDYPGTENMVIPLDATAGGSFNLANVASNDYYVWQGKATTLQYYVNKKGVNAEEGCRWVCDSDPEGCGNWAPVNIGVGQSSDGITYLSIFPNSAVSTAVLDFNIDISGDNSIPCYYHVGEGFSGSSSGCTTGIPSGGSVTITFSE